MEYLWSPKGRLPRQYKEQRLQAIEVAFPLPPPQLRQNAHMQESVSIECL